jgi:hypothetical protein
MRAVRVEGEWTRGNARWDEDGEIVELVDDDRLELYDWRIAPQLPYDLAAIRHPVDVLAFVKRWGPLHGTEEEPDALIDVDDVMSAGLDMNWLLYLYGLIRPSVSDPDARDRMAEHWGALYAGEWGGSLRRWLHEPSTRNVPRDVQEHILRSFDFEQLAIDVRQEIEEEFWDQVEQTTFSVRSLDYLEPLPDEAEPPGDFMLTARPNDLLARAHVEVALQMTAGVTVGTCPEDGRIFAVRDPRQIYCSDQCAGRARYRRWAERNRSKSQKRKRSRGGN